MILPFPAALSKDPTTISIIQLDYLIKINKNLIIPVVNIVGLSPHPIATYPNVCPVISNVITE